ncbi:MAG: class I SAM-dependent methyltransferase [Acidobacteriota bacterium]
MRASRNLPEQLWIENKSTGLSLFLARILKALKPVVLDAGLLSGPNIQFLSSLGCKVYADDILESTFTGALDYDQELFDGIMLWEAMDRIDHSQAERFLEEIERILKAGGVAFMITSSQNKIKPEGARKFRIRQKNVFEHSSCSEMLIKKHYYTNRDLMKLFERFKILCFNLLKTGEREIVIEKTK